jgi:hypothetical protein
MNTPTTPEDRGHDGYAYAANYVFPPTQAQTQTQAEDTDTVANNNMEMEEHTYAYEHEHSDHDKTKGEWWVYVMLVAVVAATITEPCNYWNKHCGKILNTPMLCSTS